MVNLTKNSLKFSPTKDIKILASYNEEDQMLEVHVKDKGKGIRRKDIEKIFTLFGQGEDS